MSMSDLQREFSLAVASLIQEAFIMGYGVTLGEAWRSPEQAQLYAEEGKGVVDSLHCDRLAIDINLFQNDNYLTTSESYAELGAWWKTLGTNYCWGGDFTTKDYNHFSLSPDGVRK